MKNMVLFGSMSGRLPGRYTDGIIVNVELVVHVVVKVGNTLLIHVRSSTRFGLRLFLSLE